MSITGIGSQSSYYYNVQTNKLASRSGEDDAFVKWYNGEIGDEELPDSFNGFDKCKKADLEAMINVMSWGNFGNNLLTSSAGGDLCEISFDIVDADRTKISVNGREVFESRKALRFSPEERGTFGKGIDLLQYVNASEEGKRKMMADNPIIPPSTYQKALKRYEEQLYLPLDIFDGRRKV